MKTGQLILGLVILAVAIWLLVGTLITNAVLKYVIGIVIAIVGVYLIIKSLKKGA